MNEIGWEVKWKVTKKRSASDERAYETVEGEGNLLVDDGASAIWLRLIGTTVDAFDNTNARLGVGTSSTVALPAQTDLLGTSVRKGMEDGYPDHTAGERTISFLSEFGSSDANFAWNEWGIFNAASDGEMLNRKVASMGVKESPEVWTLSVTIGLT